MSSGRSVLDGIGSIPLADLRRLAPKGGARLAAKLEWENPTGSMKDRMAVAVIAAAEKDGRLKPGGTVLEYTGGSTGTSSGANVVAALQAGEALGPGATVVTLMVDSGLKYPSTDVYRRG